MARTLGALGSFVVFQDHVTMLQVYFLFFFPFNNRICHNTILINCQILFFPFNKLSNTI